MADRRFLISFRAALVALGVLILVLTACSGGGPARDPDSAPPPPPDSTPPPPDGTPPTDPDTVDTVHIRRNVDTLSTEKLDSLRDGIRAMQARPETDPTSWLYQANIHGASQGPVQPAWNTCQHGSWYFLSWHRMYLFYFEKILRDATGDPEFALPYWNYSDASNPNARQIPEPYRQPADSAANPLYISQRSSIMNAGGSLPASSVSLAALDRTNFSSAAGSGLSFGGQRSGPGHSLGPHSLFESTPHDVIHGNIGGFMGSFNTAGRDPVFWLHHCNIDRLWEQWLGRGDGRMNPTPPEGDPWLTQTFEFYDIEQSAFVNLTGADILDTVTQLNYRYDDQPAAPPPVSEPPVVEESEPAPPKVLATKENAGIVLRGEPVSVSMEVIEEEDEASGELVLRLEEVTIEAIPKGHYEVYINLPEGETPNYESPYFVGNMAFFGLAPVGEDTGHDHGEAASASFTYSLAALEKEMRAAGKWTGTIEATFIRRTPEPPPGVEVIVDEAEDVPAVVNIGLLRYVRE